MTLHLRGREADRFSDWQCFSGQAYIQRKAGRHAEPIGWELRRTWVGGLAVSWDDSGARTGPHEAGLIAKMHEAFIEFCQQAGRYDAKRGPVRA
jgi:hypothetical protein